MKLRKLMFSNFRGFEQIEIDFSPVKNLEDNTNSKEVIVIAGVNGVGKSAVLQAISKTTSYLLPEITTAKKETNNFTDSDIYTGKSSMSIRAVFEANNQLEIIGNISRTQPDPERTIEIRDERERIRYERRFVEKGSAEDLEFEERDQDLQRLLKSSEDYFSWQADKDRIETKNPLVVYYSTNRTLKDLPKGRLRKVPALTTADAYRDALKGVQVSLNDFANWFRAVREGIFGGVEFEEILQMLEGVIQNMMPDSEFHDLQLVESSTPHFTIQKRDSKLDLKQLSDGERGLLALTFDLTRRLAITHLKSPKPVEHGSAIVLIDEVELHLHPSWQRKVLRRLTSTFKNCQFIVTTHSPQVIGQTKAENLRLLYEDEGIVKVTTPEQAFGMDSSWILQNIMGASARDIETEQDLGAIFDAIDEEKYAEARQKINSMIDELGGEFPEIDEASALLDRLELLEDYEEDS